MNEKIVQPTKAQVIAELWKRGNLSYLLTPVQKELYDLYYTSKEKTNVWLLGRRTGKSFCLAVLSIEECLRNPNVVVKVVCDTKVHLEQVFTPIVRKILLQCPETVKPKYLTKSYTYYFKNGSELQLAGSDGGHAEKLRGSETKAAFVDEAGSCNDLQNLVKDILLPSTLLSKGKVILASTPSKDPKHDFHKYVEAAKRRGTLIKKPTYSNPLVPKEELEMLIEELGGRNSDAYKREIECEIIRDSELSVVPEFTEDIQKEIVKDWTNPPFYDSYVGMDLGYKDFSGLVFGLYDFKSGKVIIQDEILYDFKLKDNSLPQLIRLIKEKEQALWINPLTSEHQAPYIRVSDLNPIVTQEIGRASREAGYPISFMNARKDDKEAAVNQLRLLIAQKKLIIHPRCKNLLLQLEFCRWKSNKTEFERTDDGGHADLIDALIYLVRSIAYNKNPYPAFYNMDIKDLVVFNKDKFNTNTIGTTIDPKAAQLLKGLFKF
jgi:hypothetical protein